MPSTERIIIVNSFGKQMFGMSSRITDVKSTAISCSENPALPLLFYETKNLSSGWFFKKGIKDST